MDCQINWSLPFDEVTRSSVKVTYSPHTTETIVNIVLHGRFEFTACWLFSIILYGTLDRYTLRCNVVKREHISSTVGHHGGNAA